MVGLAWFPTFDLALTVCEPQLLSKVTHSWGATESELKVIPPPSSRPFPQSCLPTQMPLSCSLFLQLPSSSLPCISSLISCAGNPQPPTHPPQLSRQVAQEKTAMGKDSQAHWRGYFAWGPLYLKLSSKAEMSWFAFSHWSMQSSWGVFLVTKYRLLWFALRPSLGLEQLWKHLYAAHLNTCFRQIFSGVSKGKD